MNTNNNYKILVSVLITILLALYSCDSYEDRLQYVFRQRITNSSKVIYKFSFVGPMSFSSDYSGITILDSLEVFSKSNINRLPADYIQKLSPNKIELVQFFGSDTLLEPNLIANNDEFEIPIKFIRYNNLDGYAVAGCGLREYNFNKLIETNDSIYFFNIEHIFGKPLPNHIGFAKGNITAYENEKGFIEKVRVVELLRGKLDSYTRDSPTTIVKKIPTICLSNFIFYPDTISKEITLSDYGIYKKIK